jgi:hypothetical protein
VADPARRHGGGDLALGAGHVRRHAGPLRARVRQRIQAGL